MREIRRLFAGAILALTLVAGMTAPSADAETVFHRGNFSEPETLDVHKSTGTGESYIQQDLYEGLLTAGPDGKPVPGAAESWTVSPDGLVYTFRIRDDARWSDGTDLTAGDFVFSWRRLVDPATASPYAFFLWPVLNGEAITEGRKKPEELGVEALDAKTLKVTLRAPTPYFLSAQLHSSTYPVSRSGIERHGDQYVKPGNLVSNGAYMLAEHVPQDHVKLVKNPYFHDAADVRVDTVYFHHSDDLEQQLRQFRAGELDATYEVPNTQLPWLRRNMPEALRIVPLFGTYYYAFNLTREPWKSHPELREALSLAIDREVITEKVTQAAYVPAYGWVPPGAPGYESQVMEMARLSQAERDERARRLLREAGYGPDHPLGIELLYNTNDNHKKIAVALAGMWKQKLGVETTLVNEEWKAFLQTRRDRRFKDLARYGWIGDYADAGSFLGLLRGDIGDQNPAAYANPAYDDLMHKADLTADPAARARLMEEAERILLADHAIVPIFFYTRPLTVAPYVEGWVDNVMNYHLSRYISLGKH